MKGENKEENLGVPTSTHFDCILPTQSVLQQTPDPLLYYLSITDTSI